MQEKLFCTNCAKEILKPNIRLKGNQAYCGTKACQNARKARWKRDKMASDPEFANRQEQGKKRWRKEKPAHLYQKRYRGNNPEYEKDNRIKQRVRNQKRKSAPAESRSEKIVKVDALPPDNQKTNIYRMKILTPNRLLKIVKVDALLVQLSQSQSVT